MIPAAAVTATIKTTAAGVGPYVSPSPKPAGPSKPSTAPQTARAPSPTETVQAANPSLPDTPPRTLNLILPGIPIDSPAHLESPETSSNPPQVLTSPPDTGSLGIQSIAKPPVTAKQQAPAQIAKPVKFAGSAYTPDEPSNIEVAITVSSMPISIAIGATLAVIGSTTQPPINVAFTPKPILTFAGSTYTADDSTKFSVAGQTLAKGGTIIVGGTQLALDQAGTNASHRYQHSDITQYEHHRSAGTYRHVCQIYIHRRLSI